MYRQISLFTFLIVMNCASTGFSQMRRHPNVNFNEKNFLTPVSKALDFSFMPPSSLPPNRAVKALLFAGMTAGLILFGDEEIDEEYGLEKHYVPLGIPKALGNIGNIYDDIGPVIFPVGVTASMLTTGLILKDKKLLKTTGLMAKSLVVTYALTRAAKEALGRSRPDTNEGPRRFRLFKIGSGVAFQSMPSGHASSIFAMTTLITKEYHSPWIKIPAYAFAVAVAFERINHRRHWTSDVLVGGVLGYFVGNYFVIRQPKTSSKSHFFVPYISPKQVGVHFDF